MHVLYRIDARARTLRITLRNAWDRGRILLDQCECLLLTGESRPTGAVGLAAADAEDTVRLLHEILRHFDHYKAAAGAYSERCIQHHSADQIVAQITAAARTQRRASDPTALSH